MTAAVQTLVRSILDNEEGVENRLYSFSRNPSADGRSENFVAQVGAVLAQQVITAESHPTQFCYLLAGLAKYPSYAESAGNSFLEFIEGLLQTCANQPEIGTKILQQTHGALNTITRKYADLVCRQSASELVPVTRATRYLQNFLVAYHTAARSSDILAQHTDFLQVALKAKQYKRAGQVLDSLDFTVDHKSSVAYSDLLVFFNFASLVYIGLKNFERALDLLFRGFGLLARLERHEIQSAVNIISVCFKRFILLSLLVSGSQRGLPRGTPQEVSSALNQNCIEYVQLADAFVRSTSDSFSAVIGAHHSTFLRDHNLGLIQQCAIRHPCFTVIKRTRAFLNLSFARLAKDTELSPSDVEKLVVRLIDRRALAATISQSDALVNFASQSFDPSQNPERVSSLLATKLQQASSTAAACRQLDNAYDLDPRIIKFELKKEFISMPFPATSAEPAQSILGGSGGIGGSGGSGGPAWAPTDDDDDDDDDEQ